MSDQCKKKYILRTDRRPSGTDRPTTSHWGNFKWPYVRKGSSDPLHVWFYGGVFEVGGSNGAISGAAAILKNSNENSNGDISAADRPIYFVFGSRMGFSGSTD